MRVVRKLNLCCAAFFLLFAAAACVEARAQGASERLVLAELRREYSEDEGEIRYFLAWLDLNGDGTPEAIAHVVGPTVCGSGGCQTHVFARRGRGFRLVATLGLTRPPIVASRRTTRGWRNLIVFVAGGGIVPGHFVEVRFDGRTYPDDSTGLPATKRGTPPPGTLLIPAFKSFKEGRPLRVPPAGN